MKQIYIDNIKQYALVDDEDYSMLMAMNKWHGNIRNNILQTLMTGVNYKAIVMARVVMKTPKHLQCDHIDHNVLNNQKYNLRNV